MGQYHENLLTRVDFLNKKGLRGFGYVVQSFPSNSYFWNNQGNVFSSSFIH